MKTCSKCKIEKNFFDFNKDKYRKDGFQIKCKSCQKQYQLKNKEKISKIKEQYYLENKEKFKQYHLNNRERKKKYISENKEKIVNQKKQWYIRNKQEITIQKNKYNLENKEKRKQWRLDNKEKRNAYIKNKKQTNPLFKLTCAIRTRIGQSIKKEGYKKTSKTHQILGCDFETFKAHLEAQFTDGMNWSNHGKWHLDHIYPVSLARDQKHVIELNHYTNFQPLWAEDNQSKGNRL